LQETLGKRLAPTLTRVANRLATFVTEMTEGRGAGGRFVERLRDIWERLKQVGGAMYDVGKFLKDHTSLIKIAAGAWVGYKTAALASIAASKAAGAAALLGGRAAAGGAAGGAVSTVGRGALLGGRAGLVGAGIGVLAGGAFAIQGARSEKALDGLEKKLRSLISGRNLKGLEELREEFRRYDSFPGGIDKATDAINRAERAIGDLRKQDLSKWMKNIRGNFEGVANAGKNTMEATRNAVKRNLGIIRDRLGKDTDEGREAASRNFRLAARAIKRSMDAGETDTKKGSAAIRRYMVRGLTALGLTEAQATAGGWARMGACIVTVAAGSVLRGKLGWTRCRRCSRRVRLC
jgi:hypothetical protein